MNMHWFLQNPSNKKESIISHEMPSKISLILWQLFFQEYMQIDAHRLFEVETTYFDIYNKYVFVGERHTFRTQENI